MDSPIDVNVLADQLREALAKVDQMDSRMTSLEDSVKRAVGSMMPKVEQLLERSNHQETATTSNEPPAPSRTTPSNSLLELAAQGDGEAILQLIANSPFDVDFHQRTGDGDTALHVAASKGHIKAVVVLLGSVVKVDAPGHKRRTPLHCAAANDHLLVARHLLDAGAQVNAKDANGATPLTLATEADDIDMVALLVQYGAHSSEKTVSMALSHGQWDLMEYLLTGVSVDACNDDGESLLVQAAKLRNWEIVNFLLQKGASATKCKDPKESALMLAAKDGDADAVRQLLLRGAADNAEQVKWALGEAKTPAVVWAFVDVIPDALQGVSGAFALASAGSKGRIETLKAMLDLGADINAKDGNNRTALWLATANGHSRCVSELLERGADVNTKDKDGDTPLHAASLDGRASCLNILLAAGASTTERNKKGKTPLEVASSNAIRQAFNFEG